MAIAVRTLAAVPAHELPTGTVTLLFTDIEGSTALVRALGGRYGSVLTRHRRLVRRAIERAGGHEIDCRADEFFVVFRDARAALDAALEAQRALAAEPWPQDGLVRVRMGLHTGTPTVADDNYLGLDVHRAARICSVAHGGQVLVSAATLAALREPAGFELRDLGERCLRGLPEPERLFQVVAPGLPTEFPPLRQAELGAAVPTEAPAATASPAREDERAPVRVTIADDSFLLREGIARLLQDGGLDVIGHAGDAEELLRLVAAQRPDVAIVDIRMPPTHTDEGLRAARRIRERHPEVGVLVLSQYVEPAYALDLVGDDPEGVGYLLKDRVADVEEFRAAVRRVAAGGSALDQEVVSQLVRRRRRDEPLDELTPREREVLTLMAEGLSNQKIADRLDVTPRAVEKHVTGIFDKLGLPATGDEHRRVLAVLAFLGR
jgi:DNA-binding NarL/FixJ family response regulator/class 3 adenylate cyclase